MTNKIVKTVLSGVCLAGLLAAAASSNAATVTLGVGGSLQDQLGQAIPGLGNAGQAAVDAAMVNQLIGMALNGTATVDGSAYTRSGNSFSPLPSPSFTADVLATGGGISFSGSSAVVTLTGSGYRYLVAKYDGPNGGAEVWDIADLVAGTVINIPKYAHPDGSGTLVDGSAEEQYQITTWTLFNPLDDTGNDVVPDGGSTVALLGFGLLGIGALRQRLGRK